MLLGTVKYYSEIETAGTQSLHSSDFDYDIVRVSPGNGCTDLEERVYLLVS